MANVFESVSTVLDDVLAKYKAITGVTLLSSQLDDSTVIKAYNIAGAVSSFTSQLQGAYNDILPVTASEPALELHLQTRSLSVRVQPQASVGKITLQGSSAGITVPANTQVRRVSDGLTFTAIESGVTGSDFSVTLFFQCDTKGNVTNLSDVNQPFALVSSVQGITVACVNATSFLDGRDLETPADMLARILAHDRDENSGGNAVAYQDWAYSASPAVVTAKTLRLLRGQNTVDTFITSGTTDIQAAVNSGQSVVRVPSPGLIAIVQAYILARNPVTDLHLTSAAVEASFNVAVQYSLYTESASTRSYVDSQLTKIIKIYIYSALSGQTLTPTELERAIDQQIGDQIYQRYVSNFDGLNRTFTVPSGQILTPGTILLTAIT